MNLEVNIEVGWRGLTMVDLDLRCFVESNY